ncbi:choline transporter-like 2 [Phymastichus coffea]|uniref:choline transporter-like 2 n=1 Tax=Phymastichus coffea TaxID=108790 RepID=UPI00273CACEB|nr:choline transporter-like 2 [Phymastichus coffea]
MSNNEEKYGTKIQYDPLWKGPMQNIRSPTDRIWLIVFCIYLIIYIGAAIYGFSVGDMRKLAYPSDSGGRFCGIDEGVVDKPYLMYLNLRKCIPSNSTSNNTDIFHPCQSSSVCVSQCPLENFMYNKFVPVNEIKNKLICTADVNLTSITTAEEIEILISNDKCAKWYLKSRHTLKHCIASETWKGHEHETITEEELKNVNIIIEVSKSFVKKTYSLTKLALRPALVATLLASIFAVIYVVLLKWLALPMIYSAICMFLALIGVIIYFLTVQYTKTNDKGILFALIICVIFIIITIIAVIYFRKKIYLACQLIKESSKAVMNLPATLAFPVIPWILYIVVVTFSALFTLSLLTITVPNYTIEKLDGGDIDGCQCKNPIANYFSGEICKPDDFSKECSLPNGQPCKFINCRLDGGIYPSYVNFLHFINLLGFYWLIFFISGFEFMVLGGTFATWYWSLQKDSVSNYSLAASISRTTRYHLGTIAIGSFILAIAQIIRLLLKSLQGKLKETNHQVAEMLVCICRGVFDLLDLFLNFLNYNAYIMCAIHGKSFCQSAKNAFNLLMRNIIKVFVVDTTANWLFFMAKVLITLLITGFTTLYLKYSLPWQDNDDSGPYSAITIVLTIIGTFIISTVFFNVQSIAVKTIFLCFLEDTERNDGSDDRPYYMSNKLEKLLQK